MNLIYQHKDNSRQYYEGIQVSEKYMKRHFPVEVKEKLTDDNGTQEIVKEISRSIPLTGFDVENTLIDILSLDLPISEWRIGEAFAEFFLEKEKGARFYWNELRDQRNINA